MSTKQTILIVEDQASERDALGRMLRSEGYSTRSASSRAEAITAVASSTDLVLCDLRLGKESGLDVLKIWKEKRPAVPFIMMTAYGEIASAVEAMRSGAIDYLTKPLQPNNLLVLLNRFLPMRNIAINSSEADGSGIGRMIGQSPRMQEVYSRIQRVAESDSIVLITGESGTGKELVASAIHELGRRKIGPYIAVNVSALPDSLVEAELFGFVKGAFTGASEGRQGRFLAADKGTLFMDEVGDLPLSIQPKLLRVLEQFAFAPVGTNEEQKVDVRLIAATSRNIAEMVDRHEFRIDLYHRLNVLAIELPPLRQRPDDIPQLVSFFLKDCSQRHLRNNPAISKDVMDFLIQYEWPGNVRQLRNAIETMVVMSHNEELTREHLPNYLSGGKVGPSELISQIPGTLEDLEKVAIQNALKRSMGNRTHAAQNLGISVRTLQRKIKQSGVDF